MNTKEELELWLMRTNKTIATMEYALCPERTGFEDRQQALQQAIQDRDDIVIQLNKLEK